jgi:nucleoside-diphosphate-sugar epimerase
MANKKIGITGHNGFLGTHLKKQININIMILKLLILNEVSFKIKKIYLLL